MAVSPVLALPLCDSRDAIVEDLKSGWAEAPAAHGLTNQNERLVELFASKDGKTWTLLLSYPDGQSCVIISGHDWRAVLPKLLKPMGLPV